MFNIFNKNFNNITIFIAKVQTIYHFIKTFAHLFVKF